MELYLRVFAYSVEIKTGNPIRGGCHEGKTGMIANWRKVLWIIVLIFPAVGTAAYAEENCGVLCDAAFYSTASSADVRNLIDAGADVNAKDPEGKSPLHWVAGATPDVIAELLANGANVTAKDKYDRTPLHFVSATGSVESVMLLLEAGADVNARTANDWTPIHGAAKFGMPENVEVLLEAGADASAKTEMGETAFQMAQGNQNMNETAVLEKLAEWP